MSIFKKMFGSKAVVVDPADLRIPELVATDKPGLTAYRCCAEDYRFR